jgi:Holliday junction DNA helicase RuvA
LIEHLAGTILYKDDERVVVSAAGVGYGVGVPARTSEALGPVGSEAQLWIKTHVTENDIELFGFEHRGEREAFETMLEISGFGPRILLALLSRFDIPQIVQIAMTGDAQRLKSVPGIGLKKAEKLILELKNRVKRLSEGIEPSRLEAIAAAPGMGTLPDLPTEAARDSAQALEALGVAPANARRAILRALEHLGPEAESAELVREGLRHRHV